MEKLQLDDFTNYRFLSGIQSAPDGKKAAFLVYEADVEENRYKVNLWLYRWKRNQLSSLTQSGREGPFLWKEDSEHILFTSMRNPDDQAARKAGIIRTTFYEISITGGEAIKQFEIPMEVTGFDLLDDKRLLITAVDHPERMDLADMNETAKSQALKKLEQERDFEVLDEIPFWMNGKGFTNKKRNRLYMYHIDSGYLDALTHETFQVSSFELDEQKKQLVYSGIDFQGRYPIQEHVWLMDLGTRSVKQISTEPFFSSGAGFAGDLKVYYYGKDMQDYGLNQNPKFYLYDLKDQSIQCLTPEWDNSIGNSVGSDCRLGKPSPTVQYEEGNLYFLGTVGHRCVLHRVDMDGTIEQPLPYPGSIDQFSVCKERILFIGFQDNKLQELHRFRDEEVFVVTRFNEWVQKDRHLVKPEKMEVSITDSLHLEGWIMKPADFDPGNQYPAILNIHGGPKTVYGEIFYHEMQYWANEGFVVFYCNPRGSDGRGNEFADIRGRYGYEDYHDIMTFTDRVIEQCPFIDRNRMGVTGGSYGGFMTNWIIGHTQRFRAAVSQRSISNWISKFATTDIGYFFVPDQHLTNPWDGVDKLWEHSPLKYADKVQTPTLFIHSEEDYRCWIPEGVQMFTALRYFGIESRLCWFRGENHELSRGGRPRSRIRRLEEITRWFKLHL